MQGNTGASATYRWAEPAFTATHTARIRTRATTLNRSRRRPPSLQASLWTWRGPSKTGMPHRARTPD
eukprot:scaffold66473_cov57-Phaeocystis_antarctica.AAC.1